MMWKLTKIYFKKIGFFPTKSFETFCSDGHFGKVEEQLGSPVAGVEIDTG